MINENKNIKSNRLINEKSPYLLQHAHNPVDWYPWGNEAFEKAVKEDKPVFLSVGYSTCHWCHVMERESFEDPRIAEMMNKTFVNIKVDREERPDIDSVYMHVCQMLTGSGGWPLTVIMTPSKKPFFAGTYFPKMSMHGRIGMVDLIHRVEELWTKQREEVDSTANNITAKISTDFSGGGGSLGPDDIQRAFRELEHDFEPSYGGFGHSPKFPTPHKLLFLLRFWKQEGDEEALNMVEKTLAEMRHGGIYDHIGYGFHRYSTDEKWLVPHFEKMLYDQAMLLIAYTEAYQATGKPEYKQTSEEIIEYVLRDMTSPDGAFYSAEDADSDGVEGKFYVWEKQRLKDILGENARLFNNVYNIEPGGNFEDGFSTGPDGKNIPHLHGSIEQYADRNSLNRDELKENLEKSRKLLFEYRKNRVHPYKDDKILTDWNGLMIAAMAYAGRVFDNREYIAAAEKAVRFIFKHMNKEGLLHRYREGSAAITAMLDDYSFLVWGLIELYQAGFNIKYFEQAIQLCDTLISDFWDADKGGFNLSGKQGEKLITNRKDIYDGAIPSGNSVMLSNLLRLYKMTANPVYNIKADHLIKSFSTIAANSPSAFSHFMSGAYLAIGNSMEIVISGKEVAVDTMSMISAINKEYLPEAVILFRPDGDNNELTRIAEFTRDQAALDGKASAYICRGHLCEQPLNKIDDIIDSIRK